MESWKEHYHPIPIGNKLLILPAWIEPPGDERIPIRIDLGMAFGTGTHPTTQLCLALAEELIPQLESGNGIKVIDIGCGSGILSIAGLKLGAMQALGVDIDPEAIRASGENAALNDVSEQAGAGDWLGERSEGGKIQHSGGTAGVCQHPGTDIGPAAR